MDYRTALTVLADLRNQKRTVIRFVTPIVSCLLAAFRTNNPAVSQWIEFEGEAEGYAANCLLKDVLCDQYRFPSRGLLQGVTYTKLSRLRFSAEVELCNSIVNDLLFSQLGSGPNVVVSELTKVIGELHDNVASHAGGAGYSCAQVYKSSGGRCLKFAIVDSGRGMLHNVRRKLSADDHSQAIEWCVQKGNTSGTTDPMAQRLPEDAFESPLPASVQTIRGEHHHAGLGLWRLTELIGAYDGSLWLKSGDGQLLQTAGQRTVSKGGIHWTGVAIEVEIRIPSDGVAAQRQSSQLEQLAKRLRLDKGANS